MKKIVLLILIITCVGKTTNSFAQINKKDSLALVDLYDSCGGPNWINHTNWLTAAPVSTWYGVFYISNGFIGGIDLQGNNLRGTLPHSIGNMPKLFSFFIVSDNHISGPVPANLTNLSSTFDMYLDNNAFTFDGIEQITPVFTSGEHDYVYAPQASIPLHYKNGKLSVYAGGTLANDTFYWYKNNKLFKTIVGDSVLPTKIKGIYSVSVTNAVATQLTLYSDTVSVGGIVPTITTVPAIVTNVCPGNSVTLTSSAASGNKWSNGAVTQSITVDSAGSYSVTVDYTPSAVTNVTYQSCTKPKATSVSNITSASAVLYWSKVPCSSDYTIEYRKVNTARFTTVTVNDTSYKITGLLPSAEYQWKVRTVCIDTPLTASAYTALTSFTTTSAFADDKLIKQENGFGIVPNPAHSSITVSFVADNENTILQVINSTGQSIMQKQMTTFSGNNTTQVDVSKLAAGVYILLVKTKSGIETKRFVKE
jgi:hypothetical protein